MKKIISIGILGVVGIVAVLVGLNLTTSSPVKDTIYSDENEIVDKDISEETCSSTFMDGSSTESSPSGAYSVNNLSEAVKALLGLDSAVHNYNSLKVAISMLSKDLSSDDVAALQELLTRSNDRYPESMRPIEINAVKNDVLDKLLRQNILPEGIGLQIVEMASNPENDPVWRDYCIQFMQPFYERASGEIDLNTADTKSPEDASVVELQAVGEAMFLALDERDSTIAGTSLIGLELLSRSHDEFDREAILAAASEIAADESASPATRMAALRMSSVTGGDESTVDTARSLAQTGETVLLRSAAIVTLGEVGTDADRELLESFVMADNQQIADAARLALEKMEAQDDPPVEQPEPNVVNETTTAPQVTKKEAPILIN